VIGASPKTRLLLDFMSDENRQDEVLGIVDRDTARRGEMFFGKKIFGNLDEVLDSAASDSASFCISLSERYFADRLELQERLVKGGRESSSVVSAKAHIAQSADLGRGSIVFPGVFVNSFATIGRCVTLYTGALIEHDCVLMDNVDIAPRCCIAGGVSIGMSTFVGINATILPGLIIGGNAVIGAGSVVTSNVPDGVIVAGNPARVIKKRPTS
jgi:acetyltransferase EpsM